MCFAPQMALIGFFIEMSFSHNLYDPPSYAVTGIRTHVRELPLFEGPSFRTLYQLSYRSYGSIPTSYPAVQDLNLLITVKLKPTFLDNLAAILKCVLCQNAWKKRTEKLLGSI